MKVRLNINDEGLAKEVMILDRYPIAIKRLRQLAAGDCEARMYKNDNNQKYVNVEDIEEILWNIIRDTWVTGDISMGIETATIDLENDDEIDQFIKLSRYLEILDKVDNLCSDLRKGWIDEEYYAAGSENDPYISIKYIQDELKRILD